MLHLTKIEYIHHTGKIWPFCYLQRVRIFSVYVEVKEAGKG